MRLGPILVFVLALSAACSRGSESEQPAAEQSEQVEQADSAEEPTPERTPQPEATEPATGSDEDPTPAAQEQEPPAPPTEPAACAGEIVRGVVAQDVQEREPVGAAGPFHADGEPTYVFLEVNNPDGPEKEYTLRWTYSGTDAAPFTQTISAGVSPTWRTWARHRIREGQTGAWTVEVLNPDGCVAHTVAFEATSPG